MYNSTTLDDIFGNNNPFTLAHELLNTFFNTLAEIAFDYMFGIAAIVFWCCFIKTVLNGKASILLLILAILSTVLAITLGQQLW